MTRAPLVTHPGAPVLLRGTQERMRTMLVALMILALSGIAGCVTGPAPIVIHEDRTLSVWLKFDPTAGVGHNHPATIVPSKMAAVLAGLRVMPRSTFGSLFTKGEEGDRVFSPSEVSRLAPLLSQAFAKASPKDMATFYAVTGERVSGPLVTSGGMVFRNGYLYLMLANARTSPSGKLYETSHEVDTRDDPLLPLVRYNFLVSFIPDRALVPKGHAQDRKTEERYLDGAKVVVIDLAKLPDSGESPASSSGFPSIPAVR